MNKIIQSNLAHSINPNDLNMKWIHIAKDMLLMRFVYEILNCTYINITQENAKLILENIKDLKKRKFLHYKFKLLRNYSGNGKYYLSLSI
jgi:hypothetical protein